MSITGLERLIPVPGVRNLRDAGGFPTAAGGRMAEALLYRSGSLHELTEEGAQQLADLGLRTVIDLRSDVELRAWPNRELALGIQVLHLPTFPPREFPPHSSQEEQDSLDERDERDAEAGYESLIGLYTFLAETAGPAIGAATKALARPGALPALVHCAVGKDRTGVTVATIQSALGVPDDHVVADYFLSNAALGLDQGPVLYIDENGEERRSRPIHPTLLLGFLTRLRATHGTAASYLHAHGVTEAELDALRTALL